MDDMTPPAGDTQGAVGLPRPVTRAATFTERMAVDEIAAMLDEIGRGECPSGQPRVGIVCDTSESMSGFAEPMASLAWVLACAVRVVGDRHAPAWRTETPGRLTESTRAVSVVMTNPAQMLLTDASVDGPVPQILTGGDGHPPFAINAAVRIAGLMHPDPAARLLVLITDARYDRWTLAAVTSWLRDLMAGSGCGVMWLCPSGLVDTDALPAPVLIIDPDDPLPVGTLGGTMLDLMLRTPGTVPGAAYGPDHTPGG